MIGATEKEIRDNCPHLSGSKDLAALRSDDGIYPMLEFLIRLEQLRVFVARAFFINDGSRSEAEMLVLYPDPEDRPEESRHEAKPDLNDAVDIRNIFDGYELARLVNFALLLGLTVEICDLHIHIDNRPEGPQIKWGKSR